MARASMREILGERPTIGDGAEAPAAEAPSEPARDTPEPESAASKPEAEPVVTTEQAEAKPPAVDESDADEDVPDDLERLKRAVQAARGDKRKARKAWRETELQLAELRGKYDALVAAAKRPVAEQELKKEEIAPKVVDLDEDAFYGKGPAAVKEYLEHRLQAEREQLTQQMQRQLWIERSEAKARAAHPDYQDKFKLFAEHADEAVRAHAFRQDDPAEYVYTWATAWSEFKDVPSIDALKAKIRAEIEAEIATRGAANAQAPKPQPTRSIAGARGTGAHATQTWTGPTPLSVILGH